MEYYQAIQQRAGQTVAVIDQYLPDPSGNALGPFNIGQTIKVRTRVVNANGTTTGSTRTLTLVGA